MVNIGRKGAFADHGTYHVEIDKPKHEWDARMESSVIRKRCVTDFHGVATHDYKISVTLDEVSQLLNVLSTDGIEESPEVLQKELVAALPALIRLAVHISGVPAMMALAAKE